MLVCVFSEKSNLFEHHWANDYSKEQFVGESRILCRMSISHCVHRLQAPVLSWLYLFDTLFRTGTVAQKGGTGTQGKRIDICMWEPRSSFSVVWGALSYCFWLTMCVGECIYVCLYGCMCVVPHILQRIKVSMACWVWPVSILGDWKDISLYKLGKMKVFYSSQKQKYLF